MDDLNLKGTFAEQLQILIDTTVKNKATQLEEKEKKKN